MLSEQDKNEIRDRIALLHGRNRDLINEVKKDPKWQDNKSERLVIEWLETASSAFYRADISLK